jgi:PAS domain S-box-containing protein
MRDSQKTRKQLLNELLDARRQLELLAEAEVERKVAGEELGKSEEKFYKAFRSSPDMVIITSIKDGKFLEVNDSYVKITGYSREELIGHTETEVNMWVNREDANRMIRLLAEHGKFTNEENSFRTKSGEIRQWLCSAEIIDIDGDQCMIAVATDITERKKAEEALRSSEEKFSKAFRASPQVISISKLSDGTFMEINDSFTRVFGYTHEETVGTTSLSLNVWITPEDRKKMIQALQKHGRINNEEYRFRTKSGEIRTVLFSAEKIDFAGEPCLIAVSIDITEYKKIEDQAREAGNLRELDKLRSQLLANVSHELRTPLASIKGFATMLLDYDEKLEAKEKREYLEIIDNNTDRLVELIEQLLEMSRLEVGMLSIEKKPTDVITLCRDVITEARVRSQEHIFNLDLPARLPLLDIDASRIRQVLDNLLDNSIKYCGAGTEIDLCVQQNRADILFTVIDHGPGIPQKDLSQIFVSIFHTRQKQKTGYKGAGLGLPISKGLVEAHGGIMWLESAPGIGTKAFFTLPLVAGEK